MNIDTLRTDGFVTVQYPPNLRTLVMTAMASWQAFCKLPPEEKSKLSQQTDRTVDFGYMRRTDQGKAADDKELFHLVGKNLPQIYRQAADIADPRATLFIKAIDALLRESAPLVREFAHEVERVYHLTGFEDEVMSSQDNWTFRLLHYFGGAKILAYRHPDRKGFTLHLNESAPGGEYLGFDHIWRPWTVSEKQTIIFPSMELQYRSAGMLKALWHQILSTPETIHTGRYAMVAFIDFRHSHRVEGRTQDFEPGFNYDIPFEEFRKVFVPRP